jgi:NADPH2:quinone reductase
MHAIRQYVFGPVDNLRYDEVPDLVPGPGEVRIAVGAAGVHVMDTVLRAGLEGGLPLPELPMTPGREVAGTVDAVGDGVDGTWRGRRVAAYLGHERSGGYAEFAVADSDSLLVVPDGMGDAEAVAMIGTGRTVVGILETSCS